MTSTLLQDQPTTPTVDAACHSLVADVRALVKALREAEFKAGFVQRDAELADRKNRIAADLDAQLQSRLDAFETCHSESGAAASSTTA